jgi:hypothetical protein
MPSNGFDSVLSGPRVGNEARHSWPAGTASAGVSLARTVDEGAAVAEESVAVPLEDVPFTDEAVAVSEADDAAPEAEDAGAPSPPPLPHAVSVASRNSSEISVKLNLLFTIFFQEKTAARGL